MTKTRSFMIVALLLNGLLFLAGCRSGDQSAADNSPQAKTQKQKPAAAGQPANDKTDPAEAKNKTLSENVLASPIKTIDGKTLKLADYKGKVVIVNFWATWCGPCRQEMPHLVKMRGDLKDQGFEVIGVTHVNQDPDPEAVREFAKAFKITYPMGYAEAGLIYGLQVDGVMGNIPQSFVISREGRVLKRFVGFSPVYPEAMRQVVEQALSEKTAEKEEKTGD